MPWTTPKTWATGELVTAVDLNTHLRDNLNYLFAPTNCQEAVGSGTDFSTTSNVNVDITGMSVNITTSGGNLLVVAVGRILTTNYEAILAINVDGTDYDVAGSYATSQASAGLGVCAFRRFAVSPGTHTVKLRIRAYASTATFAGDTRRRLIVAESVM